MVRRSYIQWNDDDILFCIMPSIPHGVIDHWLVKFPSPLIIRQITEVIFIRLTKPSQYTACN